jgi:hypothetical protein
LLVTRDGIGRHKVLSTNELVTNAPFSREPGPEFRDREHRFLLLPILASSLFMMRRSRAKTVPVRPPREKAGSAQSKLNERLQVRSYCVRGLETVLRKLRGMMMTAETIKKPRR